MNDLTWCFLVIVYTGSETWMHLVWCSRTSS